MKFCLTFKTPDVTDQLELPVLPVESELKKAKKLMDRFIEYGEYITIEFDTDEQTAVAIPK